MNGTATPKFVSNCDPSMGAGCGMVPVLKLMAVLAVVLFAVGVVLKHYGRLE